MVGALSAPFDAGTSPTTSGCPSQSTTSHSPPIERTKSRTHSAARTTSPLWASSALMEGMRRNSASSSNHSDTRPRLPLIEVLDTGQTTHAVCEHDLACAEDQV